MLPVSPLNILYLPLFWRSAFIVQLYLWNFEWHIISPSFIVVLTQMKRKTSERKILSLSMRDFLVVSTQDFVLRNKIFGNALINEIHLSSLPGIWLLILDSSLYSAPMCNNISGATPFSLTESKCHMWLASRLGGVYVVVLSHPNFSPPHPSHNGEKWKAAANSFTTVL